MKARIRSLFLPFLLLLPLLAGCFSSQNLIIGETNPERIETALFTEIPPKISPVELIQRGFFFEAGYALDRGAKSLPAEEEALARGMLSFIRGEHEQAEDLLSGVFHSSKDPVKAGIAYSNLIHLYLSQEEYGKVSQAVEEAQAAGHTPSDLERLLVRAGFSLEPTEILWKGPVEELPMDLSSSDCPCIEVLLNGREKEVFWLDTGSGISVISSDLAERLNLQEICESKAAASTATDAKVPFRLAILDSLQMGEITVKRHPVAIIDSADLTFKLLGIFTVMKVRGIIGWPVLSRFRTTLDFPRRKVTFYPPPASGLLGKRKNLFNYGVPLVRVLVDDSYPLNFFLDTGARRSSLTPAGLEKLGSSLRVQTALDYYGGAGGGKLERIRQLEGAILSVDRYRIRNLTLPVFPFHGEFLLSPDGTLGANVLKEFIVTIDPFGGRLVLGRKEAAGRSPP